MSLSNMSIKELKAERKKIDHQITDLKIKLREIEKIEREHSKEELKKYVGKCYAVYSTDAPISAPPYRYIKIIHVPQEQNTMTSVIYNENQLPAFSFWVEDQEDILKLNKHFKTRNFDEREYGFDSSDAFLGFITKKKHVMSGHINYREISQEEFNEALEKHLKCLYDAVTCI